MPNLQLNVAMGTHKGIIREHNEDAVGYHYPSNIHTLTEKGVLSVIADGVGGLKNGEQASQYAVSRLIELYYLASSDLGPYHALKSCVEQVNSEVFSKFRGQSATTLVAVVICQNDMTIAYVGDSRAYIFDGQRVKQQTKDHVSTIFVGSRSKNKLTRAIGHRHDVKVDMLEAKLKIGDATVLLTDGATPYFSETDLLSVMSKSPVDIVTTIIQSSNHGGGRDNVSVLVLAVEDVLEDSHALQQHISQLPAQVELDYPKQSTTAFSAKPWVIIPIIILTFIVAGLIFSQSIQQADGISTQAPVSNTVEATLIETNNQNIAVTITNEPDTLASIVGQSIIFEDVAITFTQLESDTSAFLIVPDKIYSVFTVFTDDNDQVWYQIHDEETDHKGWINEADLPSHTLSD